MSNRATLPVHIHVGDRPCRHIGDVSLEHLTEEHGLSKAIAGLLRGAADRMERATAVLAEVDEIVRNAAVEPVDGT